MSDSLLVLCYDVGTTGAKACLFRLDEACGTIELAAGAAAEYPLRLLPGGGAEQDPTQWWQALRTATKALLASSGVHSEAVRAIAFCCQMQGLVLVDKEGAPVRPAMTYMDQRATEQKRRGIERGVRVAGMNVTKLLPSLLIAGGVSASSKDPVWKYHWVRDNEPEVFRRVHRWLDVKEYLLYRCTGRFAMTPDSANSTFLYDTRPGRRGWSPTLCRLFDVDPAHLPEVIESTEPAGELRSEAAGELGLSAGTPVYAGGGDLSLVALGSGAVGLHETHLYMGTSGWVSAVTDRRLVDTDSYIASIIGARSGFYNYISEQETSGKCLEWARDHIALDEIGVYPECRTVVEGPDRAFETMYDFLGAAIERVPPGSGGIIFTPWLRGNRSPFEDPNARGAFFNLGLESGKGAMIRSVVEGVALHNRWQLESIRRKVPATGPVRFVGGGARSAVIAQIMSDVLGEVIETISSPQSAGALGAALICAFGLGAVGSLEGARKFVPVCATFEPNECVRETYDRHLAEMKRLYARNREGFRSMNTKKTYRGESAS